MNTQDYPTVWAYEQACKALADAKEQLAAKDAELQAALKQARKVALLEAIEVVLASQNHRPTGLKPEHVHYDPANNMCLSIAAKLRQMAGEQE